VNQISDTAGNTANSGSRVAVDSLAPVITLALSGGSASNPTGLTNDSITATIFSDETLSDIGVNIYKPDSIQEGTSIFPVNQGRNVYETVIRRFGLTEGRLSVVVVATDTADPVVLMDFDNDPVTPDTAITPSTIILGDPDTTSPEATTYVLDSTAPASSPTLTPGPTSTPTPIRVSFGPASGTLAHDTENTIKASSSGAALVDFVAEATFLNPYASGDGSWDYGFMFRRSAYAVFDIVVVRSNERWYHKARTGTAPSAGGQDVVAGSGYLSWGLLDTSFRGSNDLKLVAEGGSGEFFVNGESIATLTLDPYADPGDVRVVTGYFNGDEREGAVTRFERFTVTPLN